MIYNNEKVLEYLPHKKPFLFIDSVSEIVIPEDKKDLNFSSPRDLVGVKVIANFEVKDSLEILKGHFPGNPILPGVVLVEIMAQASAFVSLPLNNLNISGMNVETLLVSVEKAKFRKPILPGMNLEVHTLMTKCRGIVACYSSEIFVDGVKMAEADFMAQLTIKD